MLRQRYEKYLREEKGMRPRSVQDYLITLDTLMGKMDVLAEVSYREVNEIVRAEKEKHGWAPGTVYKFATCVRKIFSWLQREGYIKNNPYPFTEWKKSRLKAPKFLTVEDFEALVNDPFLSHQELTLLYMFWDTGARLSEVAQIEQRHINLEKKIVNIPFEISKGNYSFRYIPISSKLTELLDVQIKYVRARGQNAGIFLSMMTNKPLTASGIGNIIDKIGTRTSPLRAQVRLSPHQFRHSFGIRMLERNVPQVIVQKWLGHQNLQMTSHYVNMTAESSRKIFEMYVSA